MNHLISVLLISMFCVGWCRLIKPEMLLDNVGHFIERYLGKFWSKPFGTCIPCSASVIGSIGYFILSISGFKEYSFLDYSFEFISFDDYSLKFHIFYMVACVNLNTLIWFLTESAVIFVIKTRKEVEKPKCNVVNCKK